MGAFDDLIPAKRNSSGPWEDYKQDPVVAGPWSEYQRDPEVRGPKWATAPEVHGKYRILDDEPAGKYRILDDEPAKRADPRIGKPEELSFAERYLAPVLERMGAIEAAGSIGVSRGGAVGRAAMGAADPGVALIQMAANALPGGAGAAVNKVIAAKEAEYQEARRAVGSEGFDPMRLAGSAAITAPIPLASGGGGTLLSILAKGAGQGAASSALQPVVNGGDSFWADKATEAATGAAAGAAAAPIVRALARMVSPHASTDPRLALLREEGVQPTIGQSLGGFANRVEEKAMSLPIMGDAITASRRRAVEQFNEAAIDRAMRPIGERVSGVGHETVREAGDRVSGAYQQALSGVKGINFADRGFIDKLDELEQMATGLSEPMQRVWNRELGEVLRKVSPNGTVLGSDLKAVDSRLGKVATEYRSTQDPSQRELGDAMRQLQAIFKEQVGRQNPKVAEALRSADSAWAQLVRVEGAAKKAMNADGVFTPGQYNQAVREGDRSVRKRATARGTALGQDLGSAAQDILGNKYPDSGTAGRALLAAGAVGSAVANPAIPLLLAGGAAAYTPPVQNALRAIILNRPEKAPELANYLRRLALPSAYGAGLLASGEN